MEHIPRVSVCLPSLNARAFLEPRMKSLCEQTLEDWELIICDSDSQDGSWEYFKTFTSDKRVKLFSVPREGLYAGWNECLARAKGDYICIAPADDTASPQMLERMVHVLDENSNCDLAVCNYQEIDDKGMPVPALCPAAETFLSEWNAVTCFRSGKSEFLIHAAFGGTAWITMSRVVFRRTLLEKVGMFRTNVGTTADAEWTQRACLGSDIVSVPEVLATFRRHSDQATAKLLQNPRTLALGCLECIRRVLDDPSSQVPREWKLVPHWKDELTRASLSFYHETFNLNRSELRNPPRFFKSIAQASANVPLWLIKQAARGFAYPERGHLSGSDQAKHLLNLFSSPWPPRPL